MQTLDENDNVKLAAVLKAFAHPTRLRILETVIDGEFCVSEIEEQLDRSQANISQHLTVLRDRGLVTPVRKGKTVCYRLTDSRVAELLEQARKIFTGGLPRIKARSTTGSVTARKRSRTVRIAPV